MNLPYIIIDDDQESVLKTQAIASGFSELVFIASATTYAAGLSLVLEHTPKLIFLEIDPTNKKSKLSLALIQEIHQYLKEIPKIIITTKKKDLAFEAIQHQISDYIIKPIQRFDLVKLLSKLNRHYGETEVYLVPKSIPKTISDRPLIVCIKSYGDYRYIEANSICYLKADNNSTDIHLNTGEMITAFKTLKHFESVLPNPFQRIHNSYIVNRNYISRIHTGNAVCYLKKTNTKLPFSKSYKTNIDHIIVEISNGNYLEI